MTVPAARRAGLALVGLLLVAGGAACSSGPATLAGDDLAGEVASAASEAIGVEVDAVACDEELPVEVGQTTTCRADLGDAGAMDVEVEVVGADGELAVRPRAAVIDRAEVAEDLKALLKSRFERSFQADCGQAGSEVLPPDATFVCRARDADGRRSVRVTVTDVAGTLSFEVLDES